MLKDITLGQYFPVESPVHHLDARTKLILSFAFIIVLFWPTASGPMCSAPQGSSESLFSAGSVFGCCSRA